MYKFICWLDEPGKQVSRVVIFQMCIAIPLLIIMLPPNDSPRAAVFFGLVMALSAILVAALAQLSHSSWQLVLSLLIAAFLEGPLILSVAIIKLGLSETVSVYIPGLLIALIIMVSTFVLLALAFIKQNWK